MPVEIIKLTTLEQVDDMLKRLYCLENCLLALTPVIDIAHEYEDRLTKLEKELFYMSQSLENLNQKVEDEILQDEPAVEPQANPEPRPLEGHELNNARILIINEINKRYEAFTDFVKQLPINDKSMVQNAIFNLNQGLLWVTEGIRGSNIAIIDDSQPKPTE